MSTKGNTPSETLIDPQALNVNASQSTALAKDTTTPGEYVDHTTPARTKKDIEPFHLDLSDTLESLAKASDAEMESLDKLERETELLSRRGSAIAKKRLLRIWEAMNVRFEAGETLKIENQIFSGTGGKGLGSYLRWIGIDPQQKRNWNHYLKRKDVARLTGTVIPDPPPPPKKGITIEGATPIAEIAKYGVRMAQTLSDPNFQPMLAPQDRINKAGAMGIEMLAAIRENNLDQLVHLDQRLDTQLHTNMANTPHALEVVAELKARLEAEPDTEVASRLLTEYVDTLCAQFGSDKVKINKRSMCITFHDRPGRVMPGDWLRFEIKAWAKDGSGKKVVPESIRLAKCTAIAEFMSRRRFQLFEKDWQKERTMGFKDYQEENFTVITEEDARALCPEAFAPPELPDYEPPAQKPAIMKLDESKAKFEAAFATFDMTNVQALLDNPVIDGMTLHKTAVALALKRLARVKAAGIVPVPPLAKNEVDDRKRGYCPACGKKIPCHKGFLNDHWSSNGFKDCSGGGARAARPMQQPAKVLAEATKEEKRKRGRRLAKKNGGALGSGTYNPPNNGTSEHVQRSGPMPSVASANHGNGVPQKNRRTAPKSQLADGMSASTQKAASCSKVVYEPIPGGPKVREVSVPGVFSHHPPRLKYYVCIGDQMFPHSTLVEAKTACDKLAEEPSQKQRTAIESTGGQPGKIVMQPTVAGEVKETVLFCKKRVLRMGAEELIDYPVFKRGGGDVPEDVFDAEADAVAYIAKASGKAGIA